VLGGQSQADQDGTGALPLLMPCSCVVICISQSGVQCFNIYVYKHSTIELFLIDDTNHLRGNKYFNLC
jgi:hypothetical protein